MSNGLDEFWGEIMVRDILDSAAMGKLKGILQERYGMGLRIKFMQEVSSLNFEDDTFLRTGGDLQIPIQVEDKLLATAVLEKGGELQLVEQETVSQLVRLFLEPELFNWYVQQMSHNMQSRASVVDNIVSLHEMQYNEDEEYVDAEFSANVIFLEAQNPNLIPRLTHNIHEVSQHWALLKFSDIQDQVHTVADIRSLGDLTLVIDDILQVSPKHQQIMHDHLSTSGMTDEPLWVVGSASKLEDLQAQNMIHSGLAQILKDHRLHVERLPKDPKLLQESLEIMLEF
jgi:hypothetical protein